MTLVEATRILMNLRIPMRIRHRDGEYIVRGNGQEYFTTNIEDAVGTARMMSEGSKEPNVTINWNTTTLEVDLEAQRLAALEVSPTITHDYLKRCSEIKAQLIQKRDREIAKNNLTHETAIKVYRAAFLEDCFTIIREAFEKLEAL